MKFPPIFGSSNLTKEIYFRIVQNRLHCKYFEPNFIATQFATGHGKFKAYFAKFHIHSTDGYSCACGELQHTVPHILFTCPLYEQKRQQLIRHLHKYYNTQYLQLLSKSFRDIVVQ